MAAQFTEIHEELGIDFHAAFRFGIELHHPALDAFRIKLSVPRRVQRVGEVDAFAVSAKLDHLRSAVQLSFGLLRMRSFADDSAEVYRCRFSRLERIGDIELQKLASAKTGNIQEAVVEREINVRDQRRNGLEALEQGQQV